MIEATGKTDEDAKYKGKIITDFKKNSMNYWYILINFKLGKMHPLF